MRRGRFVSRTIAFLIPFLLSYLQFLHLDDDYARSVPYGRSAPER